MQRLDRLLAMVFGLALLGLALAVSIETVMRKVFNKSLQGVDELGGYILAVTAALSFALALRARTHIRIDLVHDRLPRGLRVPLNLAALLAIAVAAFAVTYMARISLQDSIAYNATAQTPWATPLRYPQAAWFIALAIFVIVAIAEITSAVALLATGRIDRLDRVYGPRGAKDELDDELADLKLRTGETSLSTKASNS